MPDSSAGVVPELRALAGSVLQYAIGLISLAGWEAREAGTHLLRLILILLGALFLLLVGYLFLLLFFVFFLSRWLGVEWVWIALTLAGVHGGTGLVGLWRFSRAICKPVFSSTLAEIKKDIEILRP
jgi:uncharacterized membrane protein YqjE